MSTASWTAETLLFNPRGLARHLWAKWFMPPQLKHVLPYAGQWRPCTIPQFPHSLDGLLNACDLSCRSSSNFPADPAFCDAWTAVSPPVICLTCCWVCFEDLIMSTACWRDKSFKRRSLSRTRSSRMPSTRRSRNISSGVIVSCAQFFAIVRSSVR